MMHSERIFIPVQAKSPSKFVCKSSKRKVPLSPNKSNIILILKIKPKFRYEDLETLQQRAVRITIQAYSAISGLIDQCPDMVEEVLTAFDEVFDSVAKNNQILSSLLTCLLHILKNGHLEIFMQLNISFKILKLLDSNIDVLSKNAFGIYLYMADGIGSKKIDSQFTKNQFVDELVLRMCTNKGR